MTPRKAPGTSSPARLSSLHSAFARVWTSGLSWTVVAAFAVGCASAPQAEEPAQEAPAAAPKEAIAQLDYGNFQLKPEPVVPCTRVDVIDVNLGHTPENFVRAAHCQINGAPAPAEVVKKWSTELRETKNVRRIDVVRRLCIKAHRKCELSYSDPWVAQPDLLGAPQRNTKRELGAVCMFFFNCPGGVNCGMNWANTHAPGMAGPVASLGFEDKPSGVYTADHAGWWRRELLDAQYAGLSFLMPNVYGPDIEDNKLAPLADALASIDNPIKIGMFDDSWTWGEPWFSEFWKQKPKLTDTDATAKLIYEHKWKPFFSQVDKKHWYLFKGKPFIYIYNAGKLEPRAHAAPVFAKMKQLFKADFGVEPFLSVDSAYFDDKRMPTVADAQFKWFTFQSPGKLFSSTINNHKIDHAMVRWDSFGREKPDQIAHPGVMMFKDGSVLEKVLGGSKDAELLVIATWNDLGEGTGFNRNYDYYVNGAWLAPDHFMQITRNAQSGK